jgi:DNA polymerase III delta subunit
MLGGVANELKPVYLFTGSDRPKIALALQRLRARVGEDATENLHASGASGADAVSACNSLGLFGGESRAVVVDGVESWKAADAKAIGEYLTSPAPDTVLVLVGDGLKKDAALAKAIGKNGEVHAYEVAKKDLPQWVGEQFARLGASIDRDACRALVEAVGEDIGDLASEIHKLATWANGDPITRGVVEELAVGRAETPIFAVTDSWGSRDVAGTLRATESLLERSQRPRSGELIRIVGSLVSHVGRVRKVAALSDEGVRPAEIASRLKMHPFVAEKSARQARNFSPDELAQATVKLAEPRRSSARANARRDHAPGEVRGATPLRRDRRRRASRPATCGARRCSCGGRRSPQRGRASERARDAPPALPRRHPHRPTHGAAA